MLPSFDAHRAPTQHPLWVAISVPLAALGDGGDRVLLAICVGSFVALVAATYRLGKELFGPLIGLVAALLLASRLDFPFLAARGFVDIPYLALVIWAAALEAAQPRRGGPVWVLLVLAGLMRPEAWVLAGIYGLWCLWGERRRSQWLRVAALVALAPVIWAITDWIVTGDPMYSLNYTTESAALLGRRQSLSALPEVTLNYLSGLTKWPVLLLGVAGIALAWRLARERMLVPLTLLVWGMATFLLVSLRGFAVIDRYLVVAAIALIIFAAFGAAGFTQLARGHRARLPWAAATIVVSVAGAVWTAGKFNGAYIDRELTLRKSVRGDLARLLADPKVREARACGPFSVPNHKLIPDLRWVADAGAQEVLARSDTSVGDRTRRGVAVVVTGGTLFLRNPSYGPFDLSTDSPRIQVPPEGFERAVVGRRFTAYVRC